MAHTEEVLLSFVLCAALLGCSSPSPQPYVSGSSDDPAPAESAKPAAPAAAPASMASGTSVPQHETAFPAVSIQCGPVGHRTPCVK